MTQRLTEILDSAIRAVVQAPPERRERVWKTVLAEAVLQIETAADAHAAAVLNTPHPDPR